MTLEAIISRVKSLELQLASIKAELERMAADRPRKTFADLYGVFEGQGTLSEEDLDAAKYRFEWEGKIEG